MKVWLKQKPIGHISKEILSGLERSTWDRTFLQIVLASGQNRVSDRSSPLSASADSGSRCGNEHRTLRIA
jgi:hypothetical protein